MIRPTTKDLAKAAGVSLATVDRVLNGRAGVRAETVRAVQAAIAELGFSRNLLAANLARGRVYRFAFLLPESGDLFLRRLEREIAAAAEAFAGEDIRITAENIICADPHQLAARLGALSADALDGVALLAPESPPLRDAVARLQQRGIRVVRFLSGPSEGRHQTSEHSLPPGTEEPDPPGTDVVGIDNRAAGATAARLIGRFNGPAGGKVLVLAERMNARDIIERRQGFDRVLTADFPQLIALPSLETHGDPARARLILQTAAANHPDLRAAYILTAEARMPLDALEALPGRDQLITIAHERTSLTERLLQEGRLDAVIAQNPGHLVRSAVRLLRARCDNRPPIAAQEEIRIEILLKDNMRA